jgi:hypothetical protein
MSAAIVAKRKRKWSLKSKTFADWQIRSILKITQGKLYESLTGEEINSLLEYLLPSSSSITSSRRVKRVKVEQSQKTKDESKKMADEDRVKVLYKKFTDELRFPSDDDLTKILRGSADKNSIGQYPRKKPRIGEAYQAKCW